MLKNFIIAIKCGIFDVMCNRKINRMRTEIYGILMLIIYMVFY